MREPTWQHVQNDESKEKKHSEPGFAAKCSKKYTKVGGADQATEQTEHYMVQLPPLSLSQDFEGQG